MTGAGEPTNDDLFALFEVILAGSKVRHMREAKRIVFELTDPSGRGDTWLFDPKRDGPLFQRGSVDGVLHLKCARRVLARLVIDPVFELKDDDDASFTGDINDLLVLAHAVSEQASALGIRLQKGNS